MENPSKMSHGCRRLEHAAAYGENSVKLNAHQDDSFESLRAKLNYVNHDKYIFCENLYDWIEKVVHNKFLQMWIVVL